MTRSDRRKVEVRDRVLRAAFDLFVTEGVTATTLVQICERADVANRTFFNHFPTRQAMLVALAHQWLSTFSDLDLAQASAPMGARLVSMFDDIATALTTSPDTVREMIGEMLAAVGHGTHRGLALHASLAEMAKQGIAAGHVSARHDPQILADLIISALAGQVGNWTGGQTSSFAADLHDTACALAELVSVPAGTTSSSDEV